MDKYNISVNKIFSNISKKKYQYLKSGVFLVGIVGAVVVLLLVIQEKSREEIDEEDSEMELDEPRPYNDDDNQGEEEEEEDDLFGQFDHKKLAQQVTPRLSGQTDRSKFLSGASKNEVRSNDIRTIIASDDLKPSIHEHSVETQPNQTTEAYQMHKKENMQAYLNDKDFGLADDWSKAGHLGGDFGELKPLSMCETRGNSFDGATSTDIANDHEMMKTFYEPLLHCEGESQAFMQGPVTKYVGE